MSELTPDEVRRRRLARLNQGALSMPHAASNNQAIPVRTSLKPLSEDSAVSTQDSDYGSLSQSFEFDDHTQDTGDKCGKRTSPTCSSSPSENFKSKRTRDGFDKDDSSQMKLNVTDEQIVKSLCNIFQVSLKRSEVSCQTVYLPSLAGEVCDMNLDTGAICNLVSQVIMERLNQSHFHQDGVSVSPTLTIAEETSQMAIDDASSDCRLLECSSSLTEQKTDSLALECSSVGISCAETPIMLQTRQLKYLVLSYSRSLNEDKNHPKVKSFACR